LLLMLLCCAVHNTPVVEGMPHVLLSSGGSRCFQYDVPRETKIEIHYKAPGMLLYPFSLFLFPFLVQSTSQLYPPQHNAGLKEV